MSVDQSIARELALVAAQLAELAARLASQADSPARSSGANGEAGRLLDAAEVAQRTGLPKAAVYRLGREGKAGAVRIGARGIRFSEAGLGRWLAEGGAR